MPPQHSLAAQVEGQPTLNSGTSTVCERSKRRKKPIESEMKAESVEGRQLPPPEENAPNRKVNQGISIADLVVRVFAALGTLASALVMGTTNQTLPIVTQLFMFRAQYNDLPTFTFFVVTNAVVCAYLVLSLAPSIFHFIKSAVKVTRLVLVVFDTIMLALLMAGASAAAAIVYLAHQGNTMANWSAICQPYNSFCERISGSLVGSYVAAIALVTLIILSTVAISRC